MHFFKIFDLKNHNKKFKITLSKEMCNNENKISLQDRPYFYINIKGVEVIFSDKDTRLLLIKYKGKPIISRIINTNDLIMCLLSSSDFEINNSIKFIYNLDTNENFKNGFECFHFLKLCKNILSNLIKKNVSIKLYTLYQILFIKISTNIININDNILEYITNSLDDMKIKLKNNKELFSVNNEMYTHIDVFFDSIKNTISDIINKKTDTTFNYKGKIHEMMFYIHFQHKMSFLPFIILDNNKLSIKIPYNEIITVNI